jgi:hypothetical protein
MKKLLFLTIGILFLSITGMAQYCSSNFGNASFEHITNVTFVGINNSSAGNNGGPVDYTTQVANVIPGNNYTLSVTILPDASEYVFAFIDWNQNGVLNDADELYTLATSTSSPGPFSTSVLVPLTAVPGSTRMRVIVAYAQPTPNPCISASYGEAEDYTVNVAPLGGCLPVTNLQASSITYSSATVSWDSTQSNPTLGYRYELRTSGTAGSGPTGLVTSDSIAGATDSVQFASLTANTNYTYYIRVICSAGDSSAWMARSFKTACTTETLPYIQDFESATPPAFPSCTSNENPGTGNSWVTNNNPGYGFTTKVLRYNYHMNAANAWFYTNAIPLTAGTSYRLKFYYGSNSTNYTEKLQVMYGSNPDYLSMTTQVVDLPNINNNVRKDTVVDFIAAASGVFYFGFNVYSSANQYYLYVDDIKISVTPTCGEPLNTASANITSSTADVSWDAPVIGTPQFYEVYYSTSTTTPSKSQVASIDSITVINTTLTGLTPATNYYYWVRSVCSATDTSDWTDMKTFLTACVSITDFTEGFDSLTTPALPVCWAKVGTTGSAYTQTANSYTSPNCLYMYSGSGSATAVISLPPVSNADAGTHRLRFKVRGSFSTGGTIQVGYLTDPTDQSTFVQLGADYVATSASVYDHFELSPVSAPVGITVLAFKHTGTPANSVLIDDVVYEAIPNCNEPSNLNASNITSSTADLSWDAPLSGTPQSYSIYYSTTNTTPSLTQAPSISGVTVTTASLASLTPATSYYVWVRSICSATDSSAWSVVESFATACVPITTLPWTEGFESVATTGNNIFPNCWSYQYISGSNAGTSTTNGAYQAPRTGTKYMYVQYGTNVWVYTPGFDLTAGTSYDFSFYMMNKEGTAGFTMDVAYGSSATDVDMTNVLETGFAANNTTYQKFKYSIVPSTTGTYYFGIKSTGSFAPWYLSYDDFTLELSPSCNEPTALTPANIAQTSADLSWTAPISGTPTSYSIYYSTTNTAPSLTQAPSVSGVTSTSTTLTGLTSAITYYVWVRSVCSATDSSAWSIATSFTTTCSPATIPYLEDFETAVVPAMPNCTSTENAGLGNNWITSNNPGNGFTTKALRYNYNSSNAANAWFYSRGVQLTAGTSYRLKFDYGNNSTGFTEKLKVNYGSSPVSGSMIDLLIDLPSINTGTKKDTTVDFVPTTTGVYYFGFNVYSNANEFNLYVDNIQVTLTPTCDKPTNLSSSNVTTNSADLSWDAPLIGTPLSYSIYYSTSNTAPSLTQAPSKSGVTTISTSLTGLNPSTGYFVWVRSVCSATDSSAWSVLTSFATACANITTLPWTEGFEAVTTPGLNIYPNCWSYQYLSGSNAGTSITNDIYRAPKTGSKYMYVQYSTSVWVYTPAFDLTAGTSYDFSFYMMNKEGTAGFTMDVAYGASATDVDMTNSLATGYAASNTTYQEFKYTFTPPTTGTYYFGIKSTGTGAPWYLSFDDFTLALTAVPVTYTSFTGKKEGTNNILSWTTATETNNIGYELERSADGRQFSKLGFVTSKAVNGNSNASLAYSFIDNKPLNGNNYYRLKQMDKDGKANFSNVVLLKGDKATQVNITGVYPNPARNTLSVSIASPSTETVNLVITDISGKVLMQQNIALTTGDNVQQIDVSKLSQGTYLIKTICNSGCESSLIKFVKY